MVLPLCIFYTSIGRCTIVLIKFMKVNIILVLSILRASREEERIKR